MISQDHLDSLLKGILARLGMQGSENTTSKNCGTKNSSGSSGSNTSTGTGGLSPTSLTPAKILVIAGLLSGALEVYSVLVDKTQTVEIVVSGSLKIKEKTALEKMLDQIGGMPFDQVMKAVLGRLSDE